MVVMATIEEVEGKKEEVAEQEEMVDYHEEEEPSQVKPLESSSIPATRGSETLGLNAAKSKLFKMMQEQNSYLKHLLEEWEVGKRATKWVNKAANAVKLLAPFEGVERKVKIQD